MKEMPELREHIAETMKRSAIRMLNQWTQITENHGTAWMLREADAHIYDNSMAVNMTYACLLPGCEEFTLRVRFSAYMGIRPDQFSSGNEVFLYGYSLGRASNPEMIRCVAHYDTLHESIDEFTAWIKRRTELIAAGHTAPSFVD